VNHKKVWLKYTEKSRTAFFFLSFMIVMVIMKQKPY